jgi:hypothetical protein
MPIIHASPNDPPHVPVPEVEPHPASPAPVAPPDPSPVPMPQPSPEPSPQPMPVPHPDPAPFPLPMPDPHAAWARRAIWLVALLALAPACGLDLPGSAPLPRPVPNPAAAVFDGRWEGRFSGVAAVGGEERPIAGSVRFSADDGVIEVDAPSSGLGSVGPDGGTTFAGIAQAGLVDVTCTFRGTLRVTGEMTPGSCTCSSLAGHASCRWTAARH